MANSWRRQPLKEGYKSGEAEASYQMQASRRTIAQSHELHLMWPGRNEQTHLAWREGVHKNLEVIKEN